VEHRHGWITGTVGLNMTSHLVVVVLASLLTTGGARWCQTDGEDNRT
jgi:hypothetical protein